MKQIRLVVFIFSVISSFHLLGNSNDSLAVLAINSGDYSRIDSLDNNELSCSHILKVITKDSLSNEELSSLITNIKDWNRGSNFQIRPNIDLVSFINMSRGEVSDDEASYRINNQILVDKIIKWLPLIALLTFIPLILLKIKKMKKDLSKNTTRDENENIYLEFRGDIEELKERISTLENKMKNIDRLLDQQKEVAVNTKENSDASFATSYVQVLFAKLPKNNIFRQDKTKAENDGNLYFKLNITEDAGIYTIVDNQEIQNSLANTGADIIQKTCEEQNDRSNFQKIITVIEPGKLRKTNNGWEITQKVKIKYE